MRYKGELKAAIAKIEGLIVEGGKDLKTEIWNDHCQVSLVNASKYFIQYFIMKNFLDYIKSGKVYKIQRPLSAGLKSLMTQFYIGYGGYFL
jgi:hypothetical protein